MKKLLALVLVLGMASMATAGVIDVTAPKTTINVGETVMLTLKLNQNPYEGFPSYNGYLLSGIDLGLAVSGPGTFSTDTITTKSGTVADIKKNTGLSTFTAIGIDATGVDTLASVCLPAISAANGPVDLVWGIYVTGVAPGLVNVDLFLGQTPTSYAAFKTPTGEPYGGYMNASNGDLGDLAITVVPEPVTMSLLAIGGMALIRRRRA